jgi:hypothetical protein
MDLKGVTVFANATVGNDGLEELLLAASAFHGAQLPATGAKSLF